ncbi:formate dehydrogenase accessory sulfurtransferase FdhD [Siphonobacter sp. SORGH_AS_0500]|uniref:formate dehydrogenase accessory sulfurtransferase FdhD n=1 Tax=Siphonobacter sp. SORGH_AS_0500 TaxID=1864824 RepID=UPI0028569E7F|nr:formate dehydrogenase accessory sulfurtransferase FdhD [Siphonobacter sp. SORGH_AS_0500]MDR6194403.1 FdhD protein [Siphonobacter sp. SORGH_AS_0500]
MTSDFDEISSIQPIIIQKVSLNESVQTLPDVLAVEEPLEIVLAWKENEKWQQKSLSVTMRTPGQDEELALGFLFSEGLLLDRSEVQKVRVSSLINKVFVEVLPIVAERSKRLQRHFYTTSSCGVCGKASLEAVRQTARYPISEVTPLMHWETLFRLPQLLREAQSTFDQTGGLHASGLFDNEGNLLILREDVGRHNALDKVLGYALKTNDLPLSNKVLLLSGRISFELVQKAVMAGIPLIAAIGAPSSLAVSLAQEHGLTLIGFLRNSHANIYSGAERLV